MNRIGLIDVDSHDYKNLCLSRNEGRVITCDNIADIATI